MVGQRPSTLTHGLLTHFTPPHFIYLALPAVTSSVSGSIPLLVHYPPASMVIDIIPLPHTHVPSEVCSQITLPVVFHPSSVDTPVDVHNPSHNFLFFHPREALLAGHWVTALPSFSCGILSPSPPEEVVLCEVVLVHLSCV